MKKNEAFNILIADSQGSFLNIQKKELQERNLIVSRAITNNEFVYQINNNGYNLVFVCIDTGDFTDAEVVSTIRSTHKNKEVPIVIVLDSKLENGLAENYYNEGVTDIIFDYGMDIHLLEKIKLYKQLSINSNGIDEDGDKLRKQINELKIQNQKLVKDSKQDKKALEKAYKELTKEIDENVISLVEINKKNDLLEEKINQLNCLTTISKLSEDKNLTSDLFLEQILNVIVVTISSPKFISAEILYNENIYQSDNFKRTNRELRSDIIYQGNIKGSISIFCINELVKLKFCTDEVKQFILTIANYLGLIIHRKETDRKLKIFQAAVDQSPLMISVTSIEPREIEYINPMFLSTLGFTLDEVNNLDALLKTPNTKLRSVRKEIVETTLEGRVWSGTFKTQKKNGEEFWQKTFMYPLMENGKVTHVLGMSEDISEEIKISEELSISKKNYEHISDNSPSALFLVNKDADLLFANKKASEITGYSNAELRHMNIQDLIHPDHLKKARKMLKSRLAGKDAEEFYESCLISKDGSLLIIEISGSKSKWMKENVDLVIINDITEKKRLNELLKLQGSIDYLSSVSDGLNQSFSQIFESLLLFNWIHGGGIYLMNDKYQRLDMVFHAGVSEKFAQEVKVVPKESYLFKAVVKKKPLSFTLNSSLSMPKPVVEEGAKSLYSLPLVYSGKVVGALNFLSKSEQVLLKNEMLIFESIATKIANMIVLIHTQDKLKIINTELRQTLIEAQEKQQLLIQKSKLESLGEMAAGVAHEINQPLGIISLSLENILYKMSAKKASQDYLDEKFNSIFNNIDKIKEIIDHVRTFSRDQKSIVFARVDVNEVVRNAYSLVNEQFIYHNITITLNLEEEVGYTLGNNHKMEQVIYNLLSNARFALNEKESLPAESTLDKEINIRAYSYEKKIFIDVKDNGIGIKKDNIDNIFNPFYTTKPEGEGTGLGLSIVYGIISDMGGTIEIESKRNEYTLVKIELPEYKLRA